jgi:radical SAM protein with 4Fe4S-binding SPASM domain
MDPKKILTSKSMCVIPWTGFILEPNGRIKNCVCATDNLGNINQNTIQDILHGDVNRGIKQQMLAEIKPDNCETCHRAEKDLNSFQNVVSSRLYYLKELKTVPLELYNDVDNFQLSTADLRWRNTCDFACIYCSELYSSRWAAEIGTSFVIETQSRRDTKQYILDNVNTLKNIYLAGGEPLLLKENIEVLDALYAVNPNAMVRVNTNLNQLQGDVYDRICRFKNVHWTVSVESQGTQFDYIRYGGSWTKFLENLNQLRKLDHKITFNMLYFVLNHMSIFDCIDFFKSQGFGDNSFVLWTLTGPICYDVRHLPEHCLDTARQELEKRMESSEYLIKHSYKILYDHLQRPFEKNINSTLKELAKLDQRRNLDSRSIFPEFYALIG